MKFKLFRPILSFAVIALTILTACVLVHADTQAVDTHTLLFELGISKGSTGVVLTDKAGDAVIDYTAPGGAYAGTGSYINSVGTVKTSFDLLKGDATKGKCFLNVLDEDFANRSLTAEMWVCVKEASTNTHFMSLGGYDAAKGAFINSSGYAFLNAYYVKSTNGTRFYPGVNTQSLGPGKADTITNGYAGDPGENRWFHLVLTRGLAANEDGTTTVNTTVYVDGSVGHSRGASMTTAAHSEALAGILLGQIYDGGKVYPKIRISYLKIYDGVMSAEEVGTAYSETKEEWSAAPMPKITSASHSDGSNVYTHDTVFTYTFDRALDASTLGEGFVLKNTEGDTAKINAVSLSADGRTVTVDAYGIETGCYTLLVTSSLRSSLGVETKEASYTYNISRLKESADSSDSALWGEWQDGTHKTATELTEKLSWFQGLSEPTGTYGVGEFFLSEGALTFRYDDSQKLPGGYWEGVEAGTDTDSDSEADGKDNVSASVQNDIAHTTLSISPPVAVRQGTLVYELSIKENPAASSSTRCGLYVTGAAGGAVGTVEIRPDMLRSYSDLKRYEKAQADGDGYYDIKLVISSYDAASDWLIRAYNGSCLLDEWSVERANIGSIKSLMIYNYANGGIYNDISIKKVNMEFYTKSASLSLGIPDSELKAIALNITKEDAILLGDTLTVTHASGANPWIELTGNGGGAYELSLFSGLPFSGCYNVSADVLFYPDALVAIPLSASFEVENASASSVYNVTVTDSAGARAYNIRNVSSVTLGYEYVGDETGRVHAGLYDEESLIHYESTHLKEKGSMSITVPGDSKYLKVFFWNEGLTPLSRALVLTDLPKQEVAPLRITAEYTNENGEGIRSLIGAQSVTLTADINGTTVMDGLCARLIYKEGSTIISNEVREITFDEAFSSRLAFDINGPFTEASRLIFVIFSQEATYYSQIIAGRDVTASAGFISAGEALLTGCASYSDVGNAVLKKDDGFLTFENVDFGSDGKNALNLYITEGNPAGADKLTIRIGESFAAADTYEVLVSGSGGDIFEPVTACVPIRNTTGIHNIYISSRGGSLAGGISGIELTTDIERQSPKDSSFVEAALLDGVCSIGADSQAPVISETDGDRYLSGINPGTTLVFQNVNVAENVSRLCVRLHSSDLLHTVTFRLDSAESAPIASFTGIADASEDIYLDLTETPKSGVHDIYVSFSVRGTSDLHSFRFAN